MRLPIGSVTGDLQSAANTLLASIDGKITAVNTGSVTVGASVLPTGAATSALQTTENATLSSIDGKITACNTGAVTVNSSALPVGAATSALQTTGNASLSSIDGKITACNTGSVTVASSALPTGAATDTLQTSANTSLNNIDLKLSPSSATITTVAANSASVQVLASNANRRGFQIYNESSNSCYLAFAGNSSQSAYSLLMAGGSYYEALHPVYTGAIAAIWNSASGSLRVTEIKA